MGYYVRLQNTNTRILKEHLDAAFEAMKALNHKPGVYKQGGGWSGGKQTGSWFSWMPENYDETAEDAKEILEMLGFYTEYDTTTGDLEIVGYDSKTGQEDLFLAEIVPFINEDAFLEWRGEDGEMWRWTPKGTQYGTVVYGDPQPS